MKRRNISVPLYGIKQKVKEHFKYDSGRVSILYSLVLSKLSLVFYKLGAIDRFVKLNSFIHGSNWHKSGQFVISNIKKTRICKTEKNSKFSQYFSRQVKNYEVISSRQKFLDDPTKLFKSTVIVLKPYSANEKGLMIIKYSYYFLLFLKLFDADKISSKYHIVLEPSWAGFFTSEILAFSELQNTVFVMCYEKKDAELLHALNCNLIPVSVGPNWWAPPVSLKNDKHQKDIDLVIVASWSSFKRHYFIFKALREVKKQHQNVRVVLIGYAGDLSKDFILQMADYFNLKENVEIYEKIKIDEVYDIVGNSKASILWSRFEGNNRSIIESMACDTPVIFREGHNFGDGYSYINASTAVVANENNLAKTILFVMEQYHQFRPRQYVESKHNFRVATKIIEETIARHNQDYTIGKAVYKVNYLWGMGYLNQDSAEMFVSDYAFLRECIRSKVKHW